MDYPRNMVGYGAIPPDANWPEKAQIAVSFVLNYEEGGESSILHGDAVSETLNSDLAGAVPRRGERDLVMESLYEYGSRVGYWRLMNVFNERKIKVTIFAIGMALERNPEAARHMVEGNHEICCHGWRWIDYRHVSEETERKHIELAIKSIKKLTGRRPDGWYTGRISERTRALIVEEGGFIYDSDAYNDDLPYWVKVNGKPWLIVPYTFDNNDMQFASAPGFNTGDQFFKHLKDSFDVLYREGVKTPKMMSIGLHCRLAGRPSRVAGLQRFLDYILKFPNVWICRRVDIAQHWINYHPFGSSDDNAPNL